MLLYELEIRDEFKRLKEHAERFRKRFVRNTKANHLLDDAINLDAHCDRFRTMLPSGIKDVSNLNRHLHFLKKYLRNGDKLSCRSDISDICDADLPQIEVAFNKWCSDNYGFDETLRTAIVPLIKNYQLTDAIRKAFIILTERLRTKFNANGTDGENLVNVIFGKNTAVASHIDEPKRQAFGNLLRGMYTVYRNRHAHERHTITLSEADAVISMINQLLREIDAM